MPTETASLTNSGVARGAGRRTHWFEVALATIALLLTGWFYYFTIQSTGTLRRDGVGFDYYNLLIDGFRAGHLHMAIEPSPAMKALSDPYDPAQNNKYRLGDASYFRGHYYMYFGVTPAAVLMLPYTLMTGQHMAQAAAVMIFCWIGLAAASGLFLSIRARYFPASSSWLVPLGIGVIGFGSHVLALARRPSVWELPIASAFAFTMVALLAVFWALHGRRPKTWMALAGLALGLAVGSRPPTLATGLMMVVALVCFARRRDGSWLGAAIAAAIPLAVIGLGLAWYNYARFGSPVQFGEAYQLTSLKEGDAHRFSFGYIAHNLRLYFTWPVAWTPDWPFVASRPVPPGPPGYFSAEELYWLAGLCPILWFVPFIAAVWRRADAGTGLRAVVSVLVLALLPASILILCFFYAAERYMVDFLPMLVLIALCGVLLAERMAMQRNWTLLFRPVFVALAAFTILMGGLASFDYHLRSMRASDPETWKRIANAVEPPVHAVWSVFQPAPKAGH